jgi:ketosteroid isomerase-like protein
MDMKDEPLTVEQVVEAVLGALDKAASRKDFEGVVALFAEDATIESPAIHLF